MHTVIRHHWVKPEFMEDMKGMCRASGDDQKTYPGFISRQVWVSMDDPLKITTVTTWCSKADRDAWWNNPKRRGYGLTGSDITTRPDEDEWWEVLEGQTIPDPTS